MECELRSQILPLPMGLEDSPFGLKNNPTLVSQDYLLL